MAARAIITVLSPDTNSIARSHTASELVRQYAYDIAHITALLLERRCIWHLRLTACVRRIRRVRRTPSTASLRHAHAKRRLGRMPGRTAVPRPARHVACGGAYR